MINSVYIEIHKHLNFSQDFYDIFASSLYIVCLSVGHASKDINIILLEQNIFLYYF